MLALALAHLHEVGERFLERGFNVRPHIVDGDFLLGRAQHARRTQDGLDIDLTAAFNSFCNSTIAR